MRNDWLLVWSKLNASVEIFSGFSWSVGLRLSREMSAGEVITLRLILVFSVRRNDISESSDDAISRIVG
ncbi:hypothetical protein Q8A67_008502 [Cirrhinus molitorella]|uniref:Uncharacterized protein n=1 Tax=Cirrhinus molitorella TaxID=172907 RepID=A0AA88PTC2_9TELE|nr:hypothetical protein Q8A67_008502 [Cirrhinus molitorella]